MLRKLVYGLGALCVALVSAELAARIDDRLFANVPVHANPDRDRDLMVHDEHGPRGRPYGSFRKWKLNNFGFLGPDMAGTPSGLRVMVLGASETFGLYEAAGNDYPARLRGLLAERGYRDIDVINAGVAGMTLPTLTRYWQNWAGRFRADIVVVYPSPHFYLDNEVPRAGNAASTGPARIDPTNPLEWSRFATRIKDTARQNPLLKEIRAHLVVSRALRGKGSGYEFTADPPEDRLAAFSNDLARLAEAILQTGATPVLVTHAFKFPSPPAPEDMAELRYGRLFTPRATPEAMPAFSLAAREAVIELGRQRGWQVIDAAAALNAQRHLFADPVHFNDAGSLALARLLVGPVEAAIRARRDAR